MTPDFPPPSLPAGSRIDPRVLMRIRNLEMRARLVVEGFWSGLHRSPYHGFSVEFTEYRQYTPGDDLRYMDWRVFGRSDRYFIKRFEDETNLRCHLLADQSRSMAYGSIGYTKADYAATLAATLGYFLFMQGDAIGLLTFDDRVCDYLPASHRTGHLRRLMVALERPAGGQATDLAAPLRRIAEIIRRRGLVILISDFLAPIDQLEPSLIQLSASGHEIVVFQIVDPAELTFEFREPALFEDAETGQKLLVEPGAARAEYLRRFADHCNGVRALCQRLGSSYSQLSTEQPLELALFDFLRARTQQARRIRRTVRPANRMPV
jgi:uncharacterized protein (DUF58 family)